MHTVGGMPLGSGSTNIMIQQDPAKSNFQQQLQSFKQQAHVNKSGVVYTENGPDGMVKYQKNRIGSTSIDQQKQPVAPKLIQQPLYMQNPKNITIAGQQPLQPTAHVQSNSISQAITVQKVQNSHISGASKEAKSRNPITGGVLLGSKTHVDKMQYMTVDNRENYRVSAQQVANRPSVGSRPQSGMPTQIRNQSAKRTGSQGNAK